MKITSAVITMLWAIVLAGPLNLTTVQPAAAEGPAGNNAREIDAGNRLRVLTQTLSKDVVLLAVGVDKDAALERLATNQHTFANLVNALTYGDEKMGFVASRNVKVKRELSRINEAWPLFNAAITKIIRARRADVPDMTTVADLSDVLLNSVEAAIKAYVATRSRQLHSQLDFATDVAARQSMLVHKILKEYLLVAHGLQAGKHAKLLSKSYTLYDRSLKGLIYGDSEQGMMAAPSKQITKQLEKTEKIWDKCLPLLKPAAKGSRPPVENIAKLVALANELYRETGSASLMYNSL